MRVCLMAGMLALAAPLAAQEAPQREALVNQVVERFLENYRTQAGLSPEQNAKFRAVAQRSFQQRREAERREREMWQALEGQMRPGVAANPDSVNRLVDALVSSRAATAERVQSDMKEYATFLSPVQRAQLVLAFERFQRSVEEVIRRRAQRAGLRSAPNP